MALPIFTMLCFKFPKDVCDKLTSAMALPIFTMLCFKFPKDVCDKLTSAMIEFWQSSGSNKKKISWVAWQWLCKDKNVGGLGFKDLEKFNQSLADMEQPSVFGSTHPQVLLFQEDRVLEQLCRYQTVFSLEKHPPCMVETF